MEFDLLNKGIESDIKPGHTIYSEDYMTYVFRFWYNNGKRGAIYVVDNIPISVDWVTGKVLTTRSVNNWLCNDFVEYAEKLDQEVVKSLDEALVKERIEMLTRQADIGKTLQVQGMEYIQENGLENSRNALTAIIKGIEVERESRGLPLDELLKLKDKSDEELVEQLRMLVDGSDILEIEPADAPRKSKRAEGFEDQAEEGASGVNL